jgi:hypothetical protein
LARLRLFAVDVSWRRKARFANVSALIGECTLAGESRAAAKA